VRERVLSARRRLRECPPERSDAADDLLTRAVERLPLSGRGRARVARVAQTISALAGADAVQSEHIGEALSFRAPAELAA
jgi:magnesium chelatase family protein